jgi:RimJ/RimL family protein N-acetyltransferase
MTDYQIDLVRFLKTADGSRDIAIKDVNGSVVGTLVFLNEKSANDQVLLSALTLWRRKFKEHFLTQFEPTVERTERWLKNVVLKDDTRIFFLIFDHSGKAIGHFGACNIVEHQAELDNVLRGEWSDDPRFMSYAVMAGLDWLYGELGVARIILHVFSNNEKAIGLYKRMGFSAIQQFALSRTQEGEDVRYLVGAGKGEPVGFAYLQMALERSCFVAARGL